MYTSVIGRKLVGIYNKKHSTKYNPKSFFTKIFHPIFYGSDQYLMWATNSPFVQGFSAKKGWSPKKRSSALTALHKKVDAGDRDASVALGFPASEQKKYASTSGQVSDLEYEIPDDDVYASWFGAALGVGVAGGYVLAFSDEQIIWDIFLGWQDYRRKLDNPVLDKLPPNKVNSWNGHWLYYQYSDRRARPRPTLSDLKIGLDEKKGIYDTSPIAWSRLLFACSRKLVNQQQLLVSVFGIGQMNKTAGFVPMQLQSGRNLIDMYQQLFGREQFLREASTFETLYGRHIKRACELGSIGLQALRPQGLEKYLKDPGKNYRLKPDDNIGLSQYFIYKTWITAMLNKNKKEVSDLTRGFAKILMRYRASGTGTSRGNRIEKELLKTATPKQFLEVLSTIVADADEQDLPSLNELRDQTHFTSVQDFRYFVTLLKFDYTYVERTADTTKSTN